MPGHNKPDKLSGRALVRLAEFRLMAEEQIERLGAAIQGAREKRGWSRSRLAREIPVDVKTVERWEKAETGGAMDSLARIAEALETSSEELLAASLPKRQPKGESPLDALSADGQLDRIEAGVNEILDRLGAAGFEQALSDAAREQRRSRQRPAKKPAPKPRKRAAG